MYLRVPLLKQSTGLGDAIARITRAVGIRPCAACKKRQALFNRLRLQPWKL